MIQAAAPARGGGRRHGAADRQFKYLAITPAVVVILLVGGFMFYTRVIAPGAGPGSLLEEERLASEAAQAQAAPTGAAAAAAVAPQGGDVVFTSLEDGIWVKFYDSTGAQLMQKQMAKGEAYYNYTLGKFPSEEAPGASVFVKDAAGQIFHTYSAYARGLDILAGTYNFLDLVPKGRDEDALPWTMAWVRHHDRYDQPADAIAAR